MQKFKADQVQRLDLFLSQILNQTRSQITSLIKEEQILINQKKALKAGLKLKIGDEITILEKEVQQISPDLNLKLPDIELEILFEDEDILVINKPANLTVHQAQSVKEATLVDLLMAKNYALSTLGGKDRVGLVHRLDKGTSGAMIIAKNNEAHLALSKQLSDKSMGRIYLALCDLALKEDKMLVQKAIIRSPHNRLKKTTLHSNKNIPKYAKAAISSFANLLMNEKSNIALIAAKLFTGRTHQIRAHLESLNRHILGDTTYGYKGKSVPRVMLHSTILYFFHPKTQKKLFIKAPFYDDFYTILKSNFNEGDINEKTTIDSLCKLFI